MELSVEQIQQVVSEIESYENQERKRIAFESFQIYGGNLRPYVQNKIKTMYPKTWDAYTVSDYSILKKITDKKSKAYKQPPIRVLESEEDSKRYQDVVSKFGLNQAMKKLDRYYNQHKYTMMAVFQDKDSENVPFWKFIPLEPYEFDVIKDDNGNVKVVILSYPDQNITVGSDDSGFDTLIAGEKADEGKQTRIYAFWTDSNHYLVKVSKDKNSSGSPEFQMELLDIPTNPMNVNPYGILPFVYLPYSDGVNYPIPSNLGSQTVELNSLLSVYLTSGNMQVGQLVVSYPEGQDIQMVTQGLMTGLRMPQSKDPDAAETKAEYISPNPNMDAHRTSIMTYAAMIMDENGIQPKKSIDQAEQFTSGIDRMLSESDVQDIVEDNQDIYTKVEEDIFKIVSLQSAASGAGSYASEEMRAIYQKPKMLVTDTEKLNNIEKMLALGLIEEWEKFIIIDPNMTEEEARKKLEDIQNDKNEKLKAMSDAMGMDNTKDSSDQINDNSPEQLQKQDVNGDNQG